MQKSSHPLLNELARLWDVALCVKHELATQYDGKLNKSGGGGSGSKAGSKPQFDSIASALKPKVQKDFAQRADEDLRRELVKFKVKIVPSERKEMEEKLMEFRLDAAVRGKRCVCGSRMVRMVAREIYGGSLSCDLCGADVRGTLLAYHCPQERNPAHPNGLFLYPSFLYSINHNIPLLSIQDMMSVWSVSVRNGISTISRKTQSTLRKMMTPTLNWHKLWWKK